MAPRRAPVSTTALPGHFGVASHTLRRERVERPVPPVGADGSRPRPRAACTSQVLLWYFLYALAHSVRLSAVSSPEMSRVEWSVNSVEQRAMSSGSALLCLLEPCPCLPRGLRHRFMLFGLPNSCCDVCRVHGVIPDANQGLRDLPELVIVSIRHTSNFGHLPRLLDASRMCV